MILFIVVVFVWVLVMILLTAHTVEFEDVFEGEDGDGNYVKIWIERERNLLGWVLREERHAIIWGN